MDANIRDNAKSPWTAQRETQVRLHSKVAQAPTKLFPSNKTRMRRVRLVKL